MSGVINYFTGTPDWESATHVKLTCDVQVPVNERIFALGQIAISKDRLYCRIWSFEVNPAPETNLLWDIENAQGEHLLAKVQKNGSSLSINGEENESLTAYLFEGEDLQGEYWGGVMSLPIPLVLSFLGWGDFKLSPTKMTLSRNGSFSSKITEGFILK